MKISIDRVLLDGKGWAHLTLPCAAAFLLFAISARAAERQTLRGHVPAAVARLAPAGSPPASQRLNLAIGLPLRNTEALTNLLHELYDPATPNYRQFLTPEQFTGRFGPSEADYQALIAFVKAQGLEVTTTHPNRAVLSVRGGVAEIEKALHLTLRLYPHPVEARKFYSPDVEPSLDLTVPVLHISGLNDYSLPRPMMVKKPQNLTASMEPDLGSAPGGAYMGDDFRAAYIPGTLLSGVGQTVGLLQFDGFYPSDITAYESLTGRPNVPLTVVPIDGGVTTPGGNNAEVCLDIEMVMSLASGISGIYVYEAPNPSPWVDLLSRMANDNLSKQLSCSWGGGPPDPAGDQIFLQMAAQGQSFFNACGDSDAFTGPIPFPAESPYIMQVGGTTLSTTGPGGAWQSEKVWNWGNGAGTCGGISPTYSIPAWQQGIDMTTNQGSTTMRNIPDVALTADNVYVLYGNGQSGAFGGTSCAAPLWAGFTALINQQAAAASQPPVGFLNPALYTIGKGPIFTSCFHDTTVGNNTWSGSPNLFFAVPGYDLCTGWGTPLGTNLINALTSPVSRPAFMVVSNYVFGGNGNGIIDYNECNSLNLILANVGTAAATGIKATLSTTTPGVAIAQPTSTYPNLPAGASGTNLVPFKVSTSPAFVCGTPIDFSLLIQCDQTVTIYRFSLPTGTPGVPIRYDNSSPILIPLLGSTNSSVLVSNIAFAINKVTVSMFVSNAYDYFLTLELVAPDGTSNILSANNGLLGQNYGLACADFQRTTFDDAATLPVASGGAPFIGSFKPDQPLAVYIGKSGTNVNGNWQLRATDQLGFYNGAIECWSLFITPTLCTDGGGQCPGADMALGMTAQPNPVMAGNNLTYSIAVTNLGPSTTTNVIVTDLLPQNVTFVSASTSQGSYVPVGGVVTFSLGPMAAGAKAALSVIVQPNTLQSNTPVTIYSTAHVSSEQPDPNPFNNTAIVPVQVTPASADLAVAIAAVPNPVLIGGTLTYTVSLTNNGPSRASSITVTNALPFSAQIQSTTVSRGTNIAIGNVILWSGFSLTAGTSATATITVTPTVEGIITAIATAGAHEFDPLPANNIASVSTTVGPAADLAIGITESPNPVVAGSNVVYVVAVTNAGPSTATGVTVSESLPASINVLSTNATQGALSISNSILTWNLGTLASGAKASLTIVAATTTNGTLSTTATVLATQTDPNPANNSATITTLVAPGGVAIAVAGATLTAESFLPPNGAIDIGETVSIILRLRNVSNVSTLNLVGTLLATDGVAPAAPTTQTYGVLAPSGFPVGRVFTFTASGTNGQTIHPTLQLHDGAINYPSVSFSFTLPSTQTFGDTNTILIPDPAAPNPPYPTESGPAKPYPSVINVSGFTGVLSKVTVTLSNFNHSYPSDVNVLLVGPGGAKALVLSHAGNQDQSSANLNLTFDDSAPAGPLPETGQLASGVWQPTAYTDLFSTPTFTNAPAGPYPTTLSALNSGNANGPWSLYVFDDSPGDFGAISNGWSLALSSIIPVNQLADLGVTGVAAPITNLLGRTLTYTFTITNAGPNTASSVVFTNLLPAGVTLVSAGTSQGNLLTTLTSVIGSLGSLNAGASATVTSVVTVTTTAIPPGGANGTITNVANVAASENDLNPVNNSVSVVTTVNRPLADVGVSLTAAPNPVVTGNNLTNTIVVTNYGPGIALAVVATNSLPTNTTLVSVSSTVGSSTTNGGTVTCSLGDLAANGGATVTVVLIPWSPSVTNYVYTNAGPVTNISTVYTNATPPWYINATNYVYTNAGPVTNISTVYTNATPPWYINATNYVYTNAGPVTNISTVHYTNAMWYNSTNWYIQATNTIVINTVYVATASQDTNSANNTATTSVTVHSPAPWIINAGAVLTYESGPINGAIDPGETVTLSLSLANTGSLDATNLVAMLLATNGVTPISGPQSYGTMIHGGPSAAGSFRFMAGSTFPVGGLVATLQLQDAATTNLGTVSFAFGSPTTAPYTFGWTNSDLITIPELGAAAPYPSSITVSNLGGVVTNATVTLNGLIHSFPTSVSVLLVSPAGANVLLMSHAGGNHSVTNLTLTFDDAVTNVLPSSNALSSGTNKPSSYGAVVLPGPAPGGPYGVAMSAVNGRNPNGTWSLYVFDDAAGGAGSIAKGWSLNLTTDLSNPALITIPDHGASTPYPSMINVLGLSGRVSKATVTLHGLTHTFPHDVNVLLVSPSGSNVLVMSHTGGGHTVTNLTLTFDDAASGFLPNYDSITNSGSYKPSSYEGPVALPGTAASKLYRPVLSGMNWSNPNGAWSLYVFDDSPGDAGVIAGGWSLNLQTLVTVGPVVDLAVGLTVPVSLDVGGTLTNTIIITNSGPDAATGVVLANPLPAGVNFVSAWLSQGSLTSTDGGQVICDLGSLPAGSAAKVIILTTPSLAGSLLNSVTVSASEEDLNPANNTAQAATTVYGPSSLSGSFSGGHFQLTVTARPGYVYRVQGSTNLTSWVSLSTNSSTTGTFNFIDTTTPAPHQRFYRTQRLTP